MALVEIARFAELREARVAKSALEAVGFNPFLFDEFRASVIWTEQIAIGGIRIMAVEEEASDARAFLDAPRRQVVSQTKIETDRGIVNTPAMLATLLACGVLGWPLAGLKRPDLAHKAIAVVLIIFAMPPIIIWVYLRFRL